MSQYVYNEHDQNQVREILRKRKEKRRRKRRRICMLILVLVFIVAFFVSDYSKIQTITISGNVRLTSEEITNAMSVKVHRSITLFTSTKTIEKQLKKVSLVKEAEVSKDLVGNINIKITETKPIAYQINELQLWLIDEKGNATIQDNQEYLSYVQRCPKLSGFDEERFKSFAKEYYQIPSQVQNQISDIKYSPLPADETRCEFIMDDGKILYLRIEDMAKQLAGDRYASIIKDFPDEKYYDFMGKYCYTRKE